ncbi:MAG: aldehyde dehydrogenase family protein, partial [Nitrososphaera sp.]
MSSAAAMQSIIRTMNPTTGQVLNEYKIADKERVKETVKKSRGAFRAWKDM